jgi:hypothetical protein
MSLSLSLHSSLFLYSHSSVVSLEAKLASLAKTFPSSSRITTSAEASLLVGVMHARSIAIRFGDIVDYVEWMIETQLIAAVGKSLTPKDFGEYMSVVVHVDDVDDELHCIEYTHIYI